MVLVGQMLYMKYEIAKMAINFYTFGILYIYLYIFGISQSSLYKSFYLLYKMPSLNDLQTYVSKQIEEAEKEDKILLRESIIEKTIKDYDNQINNYREKSDILETNKNIASRNNIYVMDDYLYTKNIEYYITRILWIIAFVFLFLNYIYKQEITKKKLLKVFGIIVFLYSIQYISRIINIVYDNYMITRTNMYKSLEEVDKPSL